jgi:protein dithiol oxidoreductase (disulfide-forming)
MHRALALILVSSFFSLSACGREPARVATTTPSAAAPSGEEDASSAAAEASTASSATNSAATASGDDATDEPGTASLERLAALPPEQQLPSGRWKPGVNYDPIVPAQPVNAAAGKVQVIEAFWLGCPHCYALEPSVLAWLRSKPDYIDFVRVPVMWGPVHRAHARLFYTLQTLGRNDEIHAYSLEASGQRSDLVQAHSPLVAVTDDATYQAQLAFAKANGVDPEAFRKAYNSAAVTTDLQHAQETQERFQIETVPFFIIDGKYSTDVGKAGSSQELFELIDNLAAAEHRRPHGNG